MAERIPFEETNLDIYGSQVLNWSDVRDALAIRQGSEMIYFLGTVRSDGRPHAAGVGPYYHDGDFYLVTGLHTQKAKNFTANPAATLSTRILGYDLTLEGMIDRVIDPETLETLAAIYREGGWPAEVEGDALTAPYSAPSAGPPPWQVFRFRISQAVVLKLSEEGGATRWRFH
ncbi:pyridoxamine 5'-phosphate oxidase family protein [soil metagenome]